MKNIDIRKKAKAARVKHWQIAEALGVSESTFCCRLRRELPAEEKKKVFDAIEEILKDRGTTP